MLGMLRYGLRSRSCIIDGEAVACDDNGVASFDLIRHHRHNDRAFLYAFDLIEFQAAHEIHLVAVGSAFRRLGSISSPQLAQMP